MESTAPSADLPRLPNAPPQYRSPRPLAAGFFVPIFVKIIIFAGQTPNFVI